MTGNRNSRLLNSVLVIKRTVWVTLGVVFGLVLGQSAGLFAARESSTITACVNKKTSALRYSSSGRCAKSETLLAWNVSGPTGSAGARGEQGLQGPRGETGERGPQGVQGMIGQTGAIGATGPTGLTGPAGAAGPSAIWSSTGFTTRNVCGLDGTTACAVGLRGPGGGLIFFVDTEGEYSEFDYLEAAPADAATATNWSTTATKCGTSVTSSCQTSFISDAGNALNYLATGQGKIATALIIARHDEGGVSRSSYAAGIANTYYTANASDWWLPSKNELNLMYTNLKLAGLGGFANDYYWSSSEFNASNVWGQAFNSGGQANLGKILTTYVRPIRGF